MTDAKARHMLPIYSAEVDPVKVYTPKAKEKKPEPKEKPKRKVRLMTADQFKKQYGILLIIAAAFTLYTILLTTFVDRRAEKRVWAEAKAEYTAQLEAYKAEQREAEQAAHWLSGDASREAFINGEIDATAHFIAEEANETMKGTKIGVAIARLMDGGYGATLREVENQPNQWMNYSGPDNKITQSDRDFAEKIVRDYYENGIIPDGLTKDILWITWTPGDYLARNNWNEAAASVKWRYHG